MLALFPAKMHHSPGVHAVETGGVEMQKSLFPGVAAVLLKTFAEQDISVKDVTTIDGKRWNGT